MLVLIVLIECEVLASAHVSRIWAVDYFNLIQIFFLERIMRWIFVLVVVHPDARTWRRCLLEYWTLIEEPEQVPDIIS